MRLTNLLVTIALALSFATAQGTGKPKVLLTWIPSATPGVQYQQLWRQSDGPQCVGPFELLIKLGKKATKFTDRTVQSGLTYCYCVTATDKQGISPCSNIATASIP